RGLPASPTRRSADLPLVDLLHAADDLGTLGPQVVEPGEVAVLAGLAGEGGVAPVVVHRRVVEPGRDLQPLLRGGDDGGAGEGPRSEEHTSELQSRAN